MTDVAISAQTPERLHALDAVRGMALMLGIVFHATLSFLPTRIPVWMIMDQDRSLTLAVVFHVLHIFRMATFFLIAGFFAHMMFHRKGAKGFIVDRLRRIALPLVVFWPLLFAAIVAVTIWGAVVGLGVDIKHLPQPRASPPFPAFHLTHLWFLYLLLIFYAAALALRGLAASVDRRGRLRGLADRVIKALIEAPMLAPLVLGAPLALALCQHPNWPMWFGVPTPDDSLIPNTPALVGFGAAFGLGWLLHRQADLIRAWERAWPLNLAVAVVTTAAGLGITGVAPLMAYARPEWRTWAYAALLAVSMWTWTFAVVGLALRFLSGHSPARRYIADASYWLYLIHMPIIMALQVAVSQLSWPWWVKFPLVLAIAFPLMFASYHLMVRRTWIGGWLNGRRAPTKAATQLPSPIAAAELVHER